MTREEILAENKRLKMKYGDLFDKIAEILFRHDPILINFGHNTDEYYPEARTILPKLKNCQTVEDAQAMIHKEFQFWFGSEEAGEKEEYKNIAQEIWNLWQSRKA
jgi:endonuclease IV